mmetsp:Transcript_32752/g.82596  ORF Transcript_32752/g.82596 Transcript_32752/m.82596 type:complete len:425 (-) Transcript_32752:238-1512(-)
MTTARAGDSTAFLPAFPRRMQELAARHMLQTGTSHKRGTKHFPFPTVSRNSVSLKYTQTHLEALPVDDRGSRLVILLLGDPHLLERRERRQDGATDPDRVLALGGSNDLDLHGRGGQRSDLLLHAVSDAAEHGGPAGEHDVAVKVLTDIDIALHDRVVRRLVDPRRLQADERGLEQHLGAAEALVADGDDLTIGKLIRLLDGGGLGGSLHLLLEVEGDIAELLLDVTHNLTLSSRRERVAALREDLHHVVGEIATGEIQTEDSVGQSVTLVDGHRVGNTVARVENDTGGAARGVQREHGLDGDVHGRGVEGLEHDLGHLLAVGLGVEGRLSEENGVLLGGNTQLVVEGVVPDLLHVIPVGDDAVLNGVLERKDTTLGLGLVADVPAGRQVSSSSLCGVAAVVRRRYITPAPLAPRRPQWMPQMA